MDNKDKLIEKQKEYIEYLIKAVEFSDVMKNITLGVREKYRVDIALIESELAKKDKPIEDRSHLITINDGMDDEQEDINKAMELASKKCAKKYQTYKAIPIKEPEEVTAEEILQNWIAKKNFSSTIWFDILEAMQSYHEAKLKEELIAYDKWLTQQYWGCEIPTPDHAVEQYLKQR